MKAPEPEGESAQSSGDAEGKKGQRKPGQDVQDREGAITSGLFG